MATKSKAVNVMDVLEQAEAKTTDKKSKVIAYPNRVPTVTELVEADKQMEEIETKIKMLQDSIRALVEGHYIEESEKKYDPSMRVFGLNGDSVTVTWQNRWTKLSIEFKDQIEKIVGDLYSSLFNVRIKIEVKDTTDEELLKSLIEKVGKENFSKYFAVKRDIVPTEKYLKELRNGGKD
jgi:hypothetical protein